MLKFIYIFLIYFLLLLFCFKRCRQENVFGSMIFILNLVYQDSNGFLAHFFYGLAHKGNVDIQKLENQILAKGKHVNFFLDFLSKN